MGELDRDSVPRPSLLRLGSAVARVSDRISDDGGEGASTTASVRQSFIHAAPRSRLSNRARAGLAAASVAVAAALTWHAVPHRAQEALTFSIADGDPTGADVAEIPGAIGEWVAATPDAARAAHFSDGSAMQLAPGARVRVTTTTAAGADVLLEKGRVHMAVQHRDPAPSNPTGSRWAVLAGPFQVRVTGTTFDATWDPTTERFELTMIEGRVLVSGPNLPPDRAVVAGEHLVVSARDGRMVLERRSSEPTAARDPGPETAHDSPTAAPANEAPSAVSRVATGEREARLTGGPTTPAAPSVAASAGSAASASAPPAPPSWKDLASTGRYADALAAAEAAGFSQEVARASLADLSMLADAARFAGSAGRAKEALLAARSRFGARGQSAFLLGKIAADQQGSPGEAITWFETYLAEQPGGPLAEQALGRVLDLTRRTRPDGAADVAKRYLARFPSGSYAALARSLVPPEAPRPAGSAP